MKTQQIELDEIALVIWGEFVTLYPTLELFKCPIIRLDGRLKAALAYSYYGTGIIRLKRSSYNAFKPVFVSDIIPHEIAHQVDFMLHGEPPDADFAIDGGHRPTWISIMERYGIQPNLEYDIT